MPVTCCACKNRAGKASGKSFYRIPADLERREKWVAAINREGWSPSEHARLCSDHFLTGKPSPIACHPDFVPSIFNKKSPPSQSGKEQERAADDTTSPPPPASKRVKKSEPETEGLPAAANSLLQLCNAADFTEAISEMVTVSEQQRKEQQVEESKANSCRTTAGEYETLFELKRENIILRNKCSELSSRLEDLAQKVTFYESENALLRQLFSRSYVCLPEHVHVEQVTVKQGTIATGAHGGVSEGGTQCLEEEETSVIRESETEREGCEKSPVDLPQTSDTITSDNVTDSLAVT